MIIRSLEIACPGNYATQQYWFMLATKSCKANLEEIGSELTCTVVYEQQDQHSNKYST